MWLVIDALIKTPLRLFYMFGPASFGMWEGKEEEDICARVSGVESSFWKIHRYQCEHLIDTKFNSFFITIQIGMYFFLLYKLVSFCVWKHTMHQTMKTLISTLHERHLLPQSKQV
jgi:hypothetical protein